jgi:cell division protein FtsZ
MKSIIEEALSRKETPKTTENVDFISEEDKELEEILKSLRTRIVIVGLGGAGSNTINRMMQEGITGAELVAANTDAQHLLTIRAQKKILLGKRTTRGLGAGAVPAIGEKAAKEAEDELKAVLQGADMVFVTCGLGGGSGTGSAPFVAQLAKEAGALTIAVVTLPFKAEGIARMKNAQWGLERLRRVADTVIVIPNDKIIELAPRLPLNQAFKVADEVLMRSITGITEIITKPGLVNLDFNDLKTIMKGSGVAYIGMGESEAMGDNRALEALEEAINSPLIEADISEATGVLVNVVGSMDMTVSEAQRVAEELQKRVRKDARIIWGAAVDPSLEHKLKVMVVITGVKSKQIVGKGDVDTKEGIDVVA